MPPQLALIVFSFFVIIILFIEHRENREITKAVWIPAVWLLYTGSKQLGFWFNIKSTIEEGSAPDRFFLIALGILAILILQKRNFNWLSAFKQNYFIVIIISYMLMSTIWSRVPGISFRRWGREAIGFMIACLLISERHPINSFFSCFRKCIYISIPFSLMLIKYFPHYGIQYNAYSGELMWVGLASQKNGLALICSFSAVFLIWSLLKDLSNWKFLTAKLRFIIDLFILILGLYLMMGPKHTLTYSSTSLISLLTGLFAIITLKAITIKSLKINNRLIIVILIIIILFGTIMPFLGKIPIKQLPKLLGRDETLTNRTLIWNSLVIFAKKRILLGYGFGGFWTTSLREEIASSAHNGYLDTILNIGFVGLFIFILFLLFEANVNAIMIKTPWCNSIIFLSIIFMFLIHNIAESSLGYIGGFPSSLIVLSSFVKNSEDSKIES
ncbi:MAG: O-antigen ligase family protein [Candidatus Aminicenantes bacterium]|nr:O-antigen ligase family protein [Candidatus Aminicenantes bacterium]